MTTAFAGPSLYTFWKRERRVWVEGPLACHDIIDQGALMLRPDSQSTIAFADALPSLKRARPFHEVQLDNRQFVKRDGVVVLVYRASARHPRYKGLYRADCMTTYGLSGRDWKIVAHVHQTLKRGRVPTRT